MAQAEGERILYQTASYKFLQQDADRLIELGEFLGRSRFSQKDRRALVAWSIKDYKSVPAKQADHYYKDLRSNLIPKIRRMKNNTKRNNYRATLYSNYYDLFKKNPKYRKLPNNFMNVVDRYNPPIKEVLLLRQVRFNNFQQQLRLNQVAFNQAMRLQQQAADNVSNAIRDQATRYSITVPGGTILHETNGVFYAKDNKGRRFQVPK